MKNHPQGVEEPISCEQLTDTASFQLDLRALYHIQPMKTTEASGSERVSLAVDVCERHGSIKDSLVSCRR